jgi:DNA (cytosine-5)-methyltransferase 1
MKARWGTGGNNVPMLVKGNDQTNTICASIYHHDSINNQDAQAGHLLLTQPPTLMRNREGKPGGGKGPLMSEDISLTIATSNDQTLFTKGTVRRLTPTECERLQAFPDGWTAGQSDSARYKQLGNAVTVSVVAWIVNRMVSVDEANTK